MLHRMQPSTPKNLTGPYQVCNHPELFERTDVLAPFAFSKFARTGSIIREGYFVICPDSWHNPIEMPIPKLLYMDGGIKSVPSEESRAGFENHWLYNKLSIWSTDWIERSLRESGECSAVWQDYSAQLTQPIRRVGLCLLTHVAHHPQRGT